MSIENPTLAHFRHFSSLLTNLCSTTVENPLQISLFMQNKANLRNDKMNITLDMTSDYKELAYKSHEKTKPIQTQLKPKQSQLKPKQTQSKPKQTQFFLTHRCQGLRIERESIRLACSLFTNCSFSGFHSSFRLSVMAILPRWQIVTERWPTSTGAAVSR